LGFSFSWFLSGFIMPLRLFPAWFQDLARWTPFPSMVNAVVEIYMGVLAGPEIARTLLVQALWAVLLFAASQLVLRAGVRRLVIQGG
jgi:ABC-2 type transport system permease protein